MKKLLKYFISLQILIKAFSLSLLFSPQNIINKIKDINWKIYNIIKDKHFNRFFITNQGLFKTEYGNNVVIPIQGINEKIFEIEFDHENNAFIIPWKDKLFKLDSKNSKAIPIQGINEKIFEIKFDHENNTFIRSWKGKLFKLDSKSTQATLIIEILTFPLIENNVAVGNIEIPLDLCVNGFLFDGVGNLFIKTNDQELFKLVKNSTKAILIKAIKPANWPILIDRNGNIFIKTDDVNKLTKIIANTTKAIAIKTIKREEVVIYFKIDNEDNLFVITNLSLLKVVKNNTTANRIEIPKKETIIDITFDPNNNAFIKTQKGNSYKIERNRTILIKIL